MSHSTEHPRVRVGVVVTREDAVLLVRHRKGDRTYWLLPGGGLEYGESVADCAVREMAEETGLDVQIGRFLFMSEAIAPDRSRHILNLFVMAEVQGGTLSVPDEPAIEEVAFVPFEGLRDLTLYPAIADELIAAWERGFEGEMRYLGTIWT